jgi:methyl-accepting chemotaxis protein
MTAEGPEGGVMTTTVSPTDTPTEDEILHPDDAEHSDDPERADVIDKLAAQLSPRRQYLIDRRRQFRSAMLIVVVVLLLLLPLNYSLHTVRQQETTTITAANPELGPVMQSRDRTELIVGVIASVVILAGVFILTIVETHRTAGAAFAVVRRLDEIREGQYGTRLTLRGGDNLREIEGPFNATIEALRERAIDDAETLDELAARADQIVVPQEAEVLAQRLRRLAKKKRNMAGTPSQKEQ